MKKFYEMFRGGLSRRADGDRGAAPPSVETPSVEPARDLLFRTALSALSVAMSATRAAAVGNRELGLERLLRRVTQLATIASERADEQLSEEVAELEVMLRLRGPRGEINWRRFDALHAEFDARRAVLRNAASAPPEPEGEPSEGSFDSLVGGESFAWGEVLGSFASVDEAPLPELHEENGDIIWSYSTSLELAVSHEHELPREEPLSSDARPLPEEWTLEDVRPFGTIGEVATHPRRATRLLADSSSREPGDAVKAADVGIEVGATREQYIWSPAEHASALGPDLAALRELPTAVAFREALRESPTAARGPRARDLQAVRGELRGASSSEDGAIFGPRVLVVDEGGTLLEELRSLAPARMIELHRAGSAGEAKAIARAHALDGVIVSLAFPGLGGLLAELRRRVPGLAIAGVAEQDDAGTRMLAAHASVDLFLARPLTGDDLSRVLVRLEAMSDPAPLRVLVHGSDAGHLLARCVEALRACPRLDVDVENELEVLVERAATEFPHVVLFSGAAGNAAVRALRMSDAGASPSVLVVGGWQKGAALSAGADDVVVSPNEAVDSVLTRALRLRAMWRTGVDPSTSLPWRHALAPHISAELGGADAEDAGYALALIEVREASVAAVEQGALRLERALGRVGRILREHLGPEVACFRLRDGRFALGRRGGEEALGDICRRVACHVETLSFPGRRERFGIALRAGVASVARGVGTTALGELLQRAERCLRAAEESGAALVCDPGRGPRLQSA